IRKATSTGLLFNPLKLYRFLDAATKSIRTDPHFGLTQLKKLANELHGLNPDHVQLLTVPLSNPDGHAQIGGQDASVVFWDRPQANAIWHALSSDTPLPGTKKHHRRSGTPTPAPTASLGVVTAE